MPDLFSKRQIDYAYTFVKDGLSEHEIMIRMDCSFTTLQKLFQAVNKHYGIKFHRVMTKQDKLKSAITRYKAEYSNHSPMNIAS